MRITTLFCLLFAAVFVSAQNDTSAFRTLKRVEAHDYTFTVPESWIGYQQQPNGPQLQKLEFTDIALPHLINDAPLKAYCLLRKINCDSIRAAQEFMVTEFSSYPDRVLPDGQDYKCDTLNIASGEQAILYSTNYLRRNKGYNFTRYDMVVYSAQRKSAYWFTATYQYKDPTYKVVNDYELKQYALRVFKTMQLR